jgi:hypothetical protein
MYHILQYIEYNYINFIDYVWESRTSGMPDIQAHIAMFPTKSLGNKRHVKPYIEK